MGTPDTFIIVDPEDAKKFLNGVGQPMLHADMQSRHFGSTLSTYYIFGGIAYGHASRRALRYADLDGPPACDLPLDDEWATAERNGETLLLQTSPFRRSRLHNRGVLYCPDRDTKPVLALTDGFHGFVKERFPWCEWEVEFKDGELVSVTPKKIQTREDVIEEVRKTFEDVLLADEHPIAVKHFYDWERRESD